MIVNYFNILFNFNFLQENKKVQMTSPRSSVGDKSAHLAPKPETGGSSPKPKTKQFGRVSKFKHLKGTVVLKEKFDNLKNLSRSVPAECNYIHGKFSGVVSVCSR